MQGLFIKLPSATTDTSLIPLNRIEWSLTANGTKAGVSTFKLETLDSADIVTLTLKNGNGAFYTDASATTSLGTSITLTNDAINTFYIKLTANDTLVIDNSNSLLAIGGYQVDWGSGLQLVYAVSSVGNSPTVVIDTLTLKYLSNLKSLSLGNYARLSGDLSNVYYSAKLDTLGDICFATTTSIDGLVANMSDTPRTIFTTTFNVNWTTIDLANVKPGSSASLPLQLNLLAYPVTVTYTGGTSKNWGYIGFFSVGHAFGSNGLTASMIDDLLISLAATATGVGGKTITINGVSRTTASNSAITTLQGKGFTVNAPAAA